MFSISLYTTLQNVSIAELLTTGQKTLHGRKDCLVSTEVYCL